MDNVRDITVINGKSAIMIADKNDIIVRIIPREDEFKKDVFTSWDGERVIILD